MPYMVKKVREEKGLTQLELSKTAGVSRQIISDLESGKPVNTTTATLQKLADALSVKVSDIFCP